MRLTPHLSKKTKIILLAILLLLVVARALAPGFLLKKLNGKLATFSPLYQLHIHDLDLHFYRMAYSIHGVTGVLNANKGDKDGGKFLDVKDIDVSLAWRELLRLKVVTDVVVRNANMKLTTATLNALSGKGAKVKEDAKNVKKATMPFDLESVRIEDSAFVFSDMPGLPPEEDFHLTHAEITANNLTPANKDGLAIFTALGDIQGSARIKAAGQLRPNHSPPDWSVNVELKNFALTKLNPATRRMVPLTFKTGELSLYAAAQSVDGKLLGYVKPFLKEVTFVGDQGDFKNASQFLVEIAGTLGNWLLKSGKNHSLATKVAFKTGPDGKVSVDTAKAVKVAVDNGFGKDLPQQIDETLELK